MFYTPTDFEKEESNPALGGGLPESVTVYAQYN
jgi:hypothetical protein